MARYAYPAIFTKEENGQYSVNFPDLEGCYTCGDDLGEALEMAQDALALTLYDYESEKKTIPGPSDPASFKVNENEFVNYVSADTLVYRKMYNNRAVKKTLTIPEWMNEAATEAGINFSQALQEVLMQKLNLN